ncbi:MAG TPA: ABC transporter permease [Pseudomonadales bacterium]|nr:ABC transporter permease [Pseudomonadales bacterium]
MEASFSFERTETIARAVTTTRPSLTYWQDAWRRFKANPRSLISLYIIVTIGLFTLVGPWVWTINPMLQDLDQISVPPGADRRARVVEPHVRWAITETPWTTSTTQLAVIGEATTQAVRLAWNPVAGASGYRVYRDIAEPTSPDALGLPLTDIFNAKITGFEDRLDLKPRTYFYSVVALSSKGFELKEHATLAVEVTRVITVNEAIARGLSELDESSLIGATVYLDFHQLGTDYLGRDMLARLMHGARVSLFIGVVAPFIYVLVGILYGSIAGFVAGRWDQLLMRFADFVVALPFLLFMILFKIIFNTEPGESGIFAMLLAMILLSWPATARLVRGQILQIREEAYIGASRLLGAGSMYLILRHMIPNTMGVILVTLTFAVPGAIFTEAFLSFIGMGVAPPNPSWGSMCNEGIKTMLTAPHELVFPAVFISLTVLVFNLLGDGLRDALDTRMRSD